MLTSINDDLYITSVYNDYNISIIDRKCKQVTKSIYYSNSIRQMIEAVKIYRFNMETKPYIFIRS
jgi:hypothetical protein